MAKVYTGRDGVMQLGGTTLAKVVSFSLAANVEALEVTTLGDSIRSYTPGIASYSGSATLLYYKDDQNTINTTNVLNKLYKTGTAGVVDADKVELTFRWVDGTGDQADNNDIKLDAYITSAIIGAATADIVRAEISFQGTGALSTVSIS
jgi:hypothetical protein